MLSGPNAEPADSCRYSLIHPRLLVLPTYPQCSNYRSNALHQDFEVLGRFAIFCHERAKKRDFMAYCLNNQNWSGKLLEDRHCWILILGALREGIATVV
jgi:hypothetical protein